jgi:hypothetical protein
MHTYLLLADECVVTLTIYKWSPLPPPNLKLVPISERASRLQTHGIRATWMVAQYVPYLGHYTFCPYTGDIFALKTI